MLVVAWLIPGRGRRSADRLRSRGLEVEEQCWKELGDRRMDGYRPAQDVQRDVRVHDVDHAVDRFIAPGAENRGTEDLPRLRIGDDLHEALRLALLDGAADAGHGTLAREER